MSKIQKAIRELQKARQPVAAGDTSAGKMPDNAMEQQTGEDTARLAALGIHKSLRRIEIERDALRAAGLLAPEEEQNALTDQFRQIKRPIVAHAFGKRVTQVKDGHLVMVTSALPGDGKSFVCMNLALSLALERDQSVLIVDADVAKGHISRALDLRGEPGLLDLLEADCTLDLHDAVVDTDIDGLSVLPAGDMRAHSTELLASNRMESLVRALTSQDPNRIILFDSPPLLPTSEGRVLAMMAGQVILIVCAGVTPQAAVIEAIELLDEGKAVNLVLNQVRDSSIGGYYGNYGGYGYGYADPGGKQGG